MFKTFLQDFCEFEQSNFWTFSEFFSGSFVDLTFSVSRLAFWEEVFVISYVIGQKNMWLNKQIVWEIERFSQTSDKIFSTIWSKLHSRSPAEKLSGNLSWKKILLPLSPKLCVEDFWTFARKFHQGCQNYILAVRRKTVRIDPEKRRYSCKFRKLSKLFSKILAKVFQQFVKTAAF